MSKPESKSSVLFIIADDWSPIAHCYGNHVIQTPAIDALAQQGTVFDQAFCTSPSCAVSRAAVLTGQHSHTHGQYGHCHGVHTFRTHAWMPTIPSLLRDAGRLTAILGKQHVAPPEVYPFEYVTPFNTDQPESSPALTPRSPADTGRAVARFLEHAGDRPFYCHLGLADPHRGHDASQFANDQAHEGEQPVTYRPEDVGVPSFLPDLPEVRDDLAQYYRAVSRFDQSVGAAVEALQQSGRADDTLIILTSDHGMPFPGAKASNSEAGHHCPLIVVDPSQNLGGLHCRAMVDWTCFLPTVLDWCGVAAPDSLPGRSLVPILGQKNPPGWDDVYYSHNFHEVTNYYPYRVRRTPRYKYVLNLVHELAVPLPSDLYRSRTWQAVLDHGVERLGDRPRHHVMHQPHEALYDLEQDPAEVVNRIDDPALRDTAAEMRREMTRFRVRTADPWLELSFQQGEYDPDPRSKG